MPKKNSELAGLVQEALDVYLTDGVRNGAKSTLVAGLGGARGAMDGEIFWLGALGYLVVLEAIGSVVARPRTEFPRRRSPLKRFEAGLLEFAPQPMDAADVETMYALRSSLAHRSDLTSPRHKDLEPYRFALETSGPLFDPAPVKWEGESDLPDPVDDVAARKLTATTVNVIELREHAEATVKNLRGEHDQGRVRLYAQSKARAQYVIAFGRFYD